MPAKYTKTYTSEAEYMYDQAVSTDLFDQTTYEELAKLGRAEDFTYGLAGTKTRKSDTFDKSDYDLLHGEDKLDYLLLEYYTEDKTSDEYKANKEYFNKKVQDAVDEKIYETLTTYERTLGTIGGFLGSALNEIVGIAEGFLDAGAFLVEGGLRLEQDTEKADAVRNFIKQDTLGYTRNRAAIDRFVKRATYIDKNDVLSAADEVFKSIVQMAPNIIGYALAPVTGGASIVFGNIIYYGSMAGRGIEEELKKNPNIDYSKLFAYAAISTGIEAGTEKLSAKMFGGNTVDKMFGVGGKGVVQNALAKTTLSVLTEGEEELIAEMFNSVFYNLLVDPNAPLASMKDLLNAAIIGGITGGVMELGGVAFSKRYVTTNDGKMMRLKDAKASGLTKKDYKKINKFTTTQLFDDLNNYQEELSQQTELDKLRSKHSNLSDADLQKNYATEYKEAVVKDNIKAKTANEISLKLATLMDKIGIQDFTNAVKLLEDTENNRRARISQYTENLKNDKIGKRIELQGRLEFAAENPGYSISVYNHAELTNNERYIMGEIEKMYGKKALFVEYGSKTGNPMENISASKNFVFIEKGLVDKTSSQQVLDTVVKNQLINEIINTPGFLTSSDFKKLFEAVMPKNAKYEQLKPQIKQYLLQNVLFDDTCNRRVLRMKFPLFAKLFNKVTKIAYNAANKKFVGTHKPKGFIGEQTKRIAFNTLMKVRKRFVNNLIKNIHNQEDVKVVLRVMNMTPQESQSFEDGITLPRINQEKYLLTNKTLGRQTADFFMWCSDMAKNIKPEELERSGGEIDFARLLDKTYFTDTFLQYWEESWENENGKSFEEAMWEEAERNGIVINTKNGEVYTKILWSEVLSDEAMDDLEESKSPGADAFEILSKYKTLKDLLKPGAEELFLWSESPENIKIDWFMDLNKNYRGKATPNPDGTITVSWNVLADYSTVANTLIHEFVHAIAIENGWIPTGTNVKTMARFAETMSTDDLLQIARKVYGTEEKFRTKEELIEKVSKIFYYFSVGEQIARAERYALSPEYDSFYLEESYENETLTLTGTGGFSKLNGKPFEITLDFDVVYTQPAPIISESRTLGIQTELAEKGIKNYEEAGFSKAFVEELTTNSRLNKADVVEYINNDEVGTEEATNKVINFYWPNNKHVKTIETAKKWFDKKVFFNQYSPFDVAYAYYLLRGDDDRFNQKKKLTLKEMALEVLCVEKNGKLVKDEEKAAANAEIFSSAQDLISRETNKHLLYTGILDADTTLTLDSIGKLIEKLAKGLGWVSDSGTYGFTEVGDTVESSDDSDSKSLSDYSQLDRWYAARLGQLEELSKENPENYDYEKEIKAIEKIKSLEDDEAHARFKEEFGEEFEKILAAAKTTTEKKSIKKRMEEILAEVENEIETMFREKGTTIEKRVADDMLYFKENNNSSEKKAKLLRQTEDKILVRQKQLFEEYFKTEPADTEKLNAIVLGKELIEQNKLDTSFTQDELSDLADKYTNPQIVIDAFSRVINDANADSIYNKINSTENSARFKRIYGEEKFKTIQNALKELLPTIKSNDTKAIEERRKKLKQISQKLTMEEKIFVRESKAKSNSPLERQEYLDGLNKLMVKYGLASEKQTKQVKVSKFSKEVLDKFKEITNEDYYSLIENGDEKQIENANKIIEDIVNEEKSQKQTVEKKEASKVVRKTLDEIEPVRKKQTKTFKDIGVDLNDKNAVVLTPYNKNKSPLENGFNLTDFLVKYVPQDWNAHAYSVVNEKKLYYTEKMRNKNAIDDLLKLAIINNPELTIETIMNDLGYKYDKKDFVELESTIAKLKESKKKTTEALKKRQSAKKKQPVVEVKTEPVKEKIETKTEPIKEKVEIKKEPIKEKTEIKKELVKETKTTKPTHGELDKDTREKAKQQEKTPDKLPSDKNIKKKMDELLSFMGSETVSEYQGDFENPVYTEALQKIIAKNRSFFDSITADEYQALRQMLLVEETTTADAALNLLIRFAYDNRFSENFKTISELIIKQHKRLATFSGQFLAGLSNTYGHHTVTSFVTEIKQKHGTDVDITESDVVKMFPEIKSYSSYEDLLRKQIDELSEKQKATKDPFEKNKLRHQIELKTIQLDALLDKDGTALIDAMTQEMLEQDHDQYKTQEKIATAYEQLISKIVQDELNKINNPSVIGKGKFDKIGTGKFFEMLKGLNSFRYLAMLSSPATAIKNGLSNTGVAALSAVSDKVGGWLENKTNWFLKTDTQINFNGEFNETFSEYVEKKYGAKISAETQGSKYTQSQQDKLRQEYAKAKDPLNKSKILSKIKSLEEKALSDARWTQPKAMKNLKNMLAGAAPQILLQAEQTLQSMYKEKTFESLLQKINKTNPELAALYQDCYSNSNTSLTSILKLGEELNVQLLDQANKDNIVNVALYRANKTFFKVDNWLTKLRGDLQKTHPGAVALLDFIIPFARTTINTTGFVIDWSPIGVAKGIAKALQTKQMQLSDMANTIEAYYKKEFKNIKQQEIKDNTPQGQEPETYVLSDKEFVEWFDTNAPKDVQQALNGDKKGLVKTYDQMVSDGKIPNGLVLANNPYARAYATEAIANGVVGTVVMGLGLMLAKMVDAFDYEDEDDYLGPIIRIGDMKIALDALSPFTTMFAIGAMLGSKNIDDKLLTTLEVFADNTVFSIIGSAISYSSSISDFIKNQSITTLQQFVPAIFKTLTKIIDNSKKDKSGSYFEKLIKTTAANMPLFSNLVPNKINPYTGEIEKNYESGVLEGITNALLPWGRVEVKSDFEKEAERLDNKTDGLAGWFEIDDVKYTLTGQEREVYGKYKAEYIKNKYDAIVSGKEKVTVTTETGERKTTTYDKLTDKEKQNVLDQIYSSGSSTTRIKYWLDKNNMYITSNYDEYIRLKKQFNTSKIRYNQGWKKSKFVEV